MKPKRTFTELTIHDAVVRGRGWSLNYGANTVAPTPNYTT
jgi:hypothetical protein